jgi:hypothetical protein
MNQLKNFVLKTYSKPVQGDPAQRRRDKIVAAIGVQKLVLAAAIKGETYTVPAKAEGKEAKAVRPWWIAGEGGYFVLCKYGARTLPLVPDKNSIFVNKLEEVGAALAAFAAAAKSGELDAAIAAVADRKKG